MLAVSGFDVSMKPAPQQRQLWVDIGSTEWAIGVVSIVVPRTWRRSSEALKRENLRHNRRIEFSLKSRQPRSCFCRLIFAKDVDGASVFQPPTVIALTGVGAQVYFEQNLQIDSGRVEIDNDSFRESIEWRPGPDPPRLHCADSVEILENSLRAPIAPAAESDFLHYRRAPYIVAGSRTPSSPVIWIMVCAAARPCPGRHRRRLIQPHSCSLDAPRAPWQPGQEYARR